MGSYEQKAPEKGTKLRDVRVIHPHHPLNGQIVKVLRLASDPPGGERSWIIEAADGERLKLPQAWVEPLRPVEAAQIEPEAGAGLPTGGLRLWVDLAGLQKLARLVYYLQRPSSKEVTADETLKPIPGSTGPTPAALAGEPFVAPLVRVAVDPPTGVDHDPFQSVAALLASPAQPTPGGEP